MQELLPPLDIMIAIVGTAALPVIFAVLGHLVPSRSSILIRLASSCAIVIVFWLGSVSLSGYRLQAASAFSSFCILAIGAMVLYIGASLLAYSFRLESLAAIGRRDGATFDDLAESFGDGAGLSALLHGRLHTLKALRAVRQIGDDEFQITRVGRVIARSYIIIRQIARMD